MVVGEVYKDGKYDFGVARYNADGSTDTSFSGDGKLTNDFGYLGNSDSAYAVAIQTVGVPEVEKILVAGNAYNGYNYDFIVVRYNPDGALDTTFGDDGKVQVDFDGGNDYAYGIAVDPASGWIIVVGQAYNNGQFDSAMLRLDPDGELDTTFGGTQDGKVYTNMGGTDYALSVALQSDGKIVVAGAASPASNFDFAVARYNSDGTLDTTFSDDGKLLTPIGSYNDYAYAVAIDGDGNIVVAGNAWIVGDTDFAVARFHSSDTENWDPGDLDTTFDTDGKVLTHFDFGNDYAYGVVIEPDNKIVAAGRAYNGTNDDFALACYNPNGSLYAPFGTSGKVLSDFASSTGSQPVSGWDGAQAIALVPGEDVITGGLDSLDLIVAGQVWTGQYDFAAVRCFSPSGGLPVQVPNVAPTLTVADPQTVLVGQSFTITDLGTFTDPGFDNPNVNPATHETFTYEIDWRDGTSHDSGYATIDTPGSAGQPTEGSFDGTHTYAQTGDYSVKITLSDDDNGEDIQYLDITSAPDVSATGFSADGESLLVDYTVAGAALPSLTIGIYASSDGTTPESLLQTLNVTNSTDLSVGAHEVCITPDIPDIQDDYFLIAVVDADGAITEPDEDNNDLLFEGGVFQTVGGTVYVHGDAGADPVQVSSTGVVQVTYDSVTYTYTYSPGPMPPVQIHGHEGNDTLTTTMTIACPLVVFGGPGDDSLTAGTGADFVDGGLGADTVNGGAENDFIDGGDGNDDIEGAAGADVIHGGLGDDSADGGDDDDMIYGEDGDDTLWGGIGDDWIEGGQGNDTAYGGPWNDALFGDAGADRLYGDDAQFTEHGQDILVGGEGDDDRLAGGNGIDEIYGGPGVDNLDGGNERDILRGGDGNDYLYGGDDDGDDDLDGEGGADTLDGGPLENPGVDDPLYIDEKIIDITGHHWGFYSGGYDGDHAVSTGEYREDYTWPVTDMWHRAYEEVFVTWVPGDGLGTGVEYYVNHGGGPSGKITVNQQDEPPGSVPDDPFAWKSLGVWDGVSSVYIIAPLLPSQPYKHVCADAVLLRGVDPISDIQTDSRNDGQITAEDDPAENHPTGPGRIVAIGSSQLTEVRLDAAMVDAVLSEPQQWDAYLVILLSRLFPRMELSTW